MSSINPPNKGYRPPVIDYGNPIAKGIVLDWNAYFQSPFKAIDNVHNSVATVTNSPTTSIRKYGPSIDMGTNADYAWSDKEWASKFNQISLEMIFLRDGPGTNNYGLLFRHWDSALDKKWVEVYNDNGNGGWGLSFNFQFDDRQRIWSVPYPTNGEVNHYILTYDHTVYTGSAPLIWKNGVAQTLTDRLNNSQSNTWTPNDLQIGINWDGAHYLYRYWNRLLTANEVTSLFVDPWQIYKQPRFSILNAIAGGAFSQTLTDILTLVDTPTKQTARTLSDVLTLVDTIIKAPERILSEILTLVDSIIKGRTFTETLTLVDNAYKDTSRTLEEAITLVGTALNNPQRTLSEAITLVDTFTGKITERILSEAITLVDSIERSLSRTLTETATLVDSAIKDTVRTLTDTATLQDTVLKLPERILSETLSLTDSLVRVISRTLSEVITLVDVFAGAVGATYAQVLTEIITLNDSLVRSMNKVLTEVLTLEDWVYQRLVRVSTAFNAFVATAASWVKQTATAGGFSKETPASATFTKETGSSSTFSKEDKPGGA